MRARTQDPRHIKWGPEKTVGGAFGAAGLIALGILNPPAGALAIGYIVATAGTTSFTGYSFYKWIKPTQEDKNLKFFFDDP